MTEDRVVMAPFRHHNAGRLTEALIDVVYEHGEGVSVAEVIGAIEFAKAHFINEACQRAEDLGE